jgi:hypothetical protein
MSWNRISNGYKYIVCPDGFLSMANSCGFISEHRLVAAIKYGRMLGSKELVHHIDGNKLNNNSNNLMIVDGHGHCKIHRAERNGKLKIKILKPGIDFPVAFPKDGFRRCILCGCVIPSWKRSDRLCSALCSRRWWRINNPEKYEAIKRG